MKEQVLSIEQMQELIGMGIDTSQASMYYEKLPTGSVYLNISDEYKEMLFGTVTENGIEYIPTFTLQDILLLTKNTQPSLWSKDGMPLWCIQDYMANCYFSDKNIMTIMFKYIKWCKQNNYI